jgi:class 3 adenylate cyclase/tetratricopeptide (TPR) repeat protein
MVCPACGAPAHGDARFCSACGSRLPAPCPACGSPIQPSDRFCEHCGVALRAGQAPRPGLGDSPTGERRHVTVLFSDLVNSTAIAAHLDPEEWRELSASYQRAAAEAVGRFGGHVAKYLGDGLVVYFGFPQASENGPERAVRAGLLIMEVLESLNRGKQDENKHLVVRVGIHTGEVVIGQDGGGNPELFGDTTNLAARVQSAAEPGTLLITAPVHQMVSGLFVVEPRGAHQLKGIPEPVELFRVSQASGVRGRIHAAAAAKGLISFVGREEELGVLWRRWERAREGEGQVVVIAGEAGIGKSRLVEEMHTRLARIPHTWIECACDQLLQNTPFHPVSEMLRSAFPQRPEDSADRRLEELKNALEAVGVREADLPLVAPLLDLPVPASYPPLLATPNQQHRRLLATLAQWLFGLARAQPVVIAIEDLHWADPSSLELARLLSEQNATEPVLILFTTRSEFRVPWQLRAHHAHLTLSPLSRRETRALVEEVAASAVLAGDTVEAVVDRTGGVPLFIEELTRLMIDSGGRSGTREIPPTLHDSLAARLGRVGSAREIAQIGAVLGREFSYDLVHAVSGVAESELQAALERLADADLLHVRGVPPEAWYRFKHALLQDAAYDALLKTRRRDLHRVAGRVLSTQFKDLAESQPEVVARHLTEANEFDDAVFAWQRAGNEATRRGAFTEAEGHFRHALEVFAKLPEAAERGPRELALKGDLAITLLATKGWSSPEAKKIFEDALSVSKRFADPMIMTLLLAAFFGSVFTAGEMVAAAATGGEISAVAEQTGSRFARTWAEAMLSMVQLVSGDLTGARASAARSITAYDEAEHSLSPINPVVLARGQESAAAVISGEIELGVAKASEMLAAAAQGKRALDMAQARTEALAIYFHLRDAAEVEKHAQALIADAKQHDMQAYLAWAMIYQGWSIAMRENAFEGRAILRKGLDLYAAGGRRLLINRFLSMLADVQAAVGLLDHAVDAIDEALDAAPEQKIDEPTILWRRGELLVKKSAQATNGYDATLLERAERDFREAITRAHAMGAKLYELRAANSLTRILKVRGEIRQARQLLQPLYDSFAPCDDSSDLKEAGTLLKELEC